MGYASIQNVQARDPTLVFTATSTPNASQVAQFIEDTAAELDGILAARDFSVPVPTTATQAFALLRSYNALGANALVQEASPTSRSRDQARALWEDCKKALRAGDITLSDAESDPGGLPLGPSTGARGAARDPWFPATYADQL